MKRDTYLLSVLYRSRSNHMQAATKYCKI